MNFGNLGAAYLGFQGAQQNSQALKNQALMIQQRQAELDDHKRQLAAQAAAYMGLGQGGGMGGGAPSNMPVPQMAPPPPGMFAGGQQGPQPPMPGQASMPAQPRPQPFSGGAPPMGVEGAGARFMDRQAPAPAAEAPAIEKVAIEAAAPAQSETEPLQVLAKIAADVRARNPGIDPETTALAVQEIVGQMKNVAPDVRAQLQHMASLYKTDATVGLGREKIKATGDNLEKTIGSREKIAGDRNATQKDLGQLRADTSIKTTGMREAGQNSRASSAEAGRNSRASARATGTPAEDKAASRTHAAKLNLLRAQESEIIAQMQSQVSGTKAWKDLSAKKQAIRGQITQLQASRASSLGGGSAPAAPAARPAAAAAPKAAVPAGAPTATGADGKKVYWNGKAWLPAS